MTKKELLEQLECVGDDEQIYFAYPSGDYWDTVLVAPVSDIQEHAQIEPSSYHRTLQVVEDRPNSEDKMFNGVVLFG